ncbi:MAG TPA: alpha/beta hydrolase [Devosia sp.]|nr:alpha/beta hydrolase [Devosia sp.]
MRKADFLSLPVPELPPVRYVARGYYTSAYYVVEPKRMSGNEGVAPPQSEEKFDPELEPDYFEEFGYPKSAPTPQTTKHEEYQTIVLCHGLAANGLQFVADAHFFAAQGFRVIVPDLRGHGRSKIPDEKLISDADITIRILAEDLVAILDKEGVKKAHWVGNSLGGIVALSLMDTHPRRLGDVVVFGTSFSMDISPRFTTIAQGASKLISQKNLALLGARLTSNKPEAQAIIYQMIRKANPKITFGIARYLAKYDMIENARTFDGAILMLRADKDILINRAMKATLPEMQDNNLFFRKDIQNAGHCANLDQPQIVREAILDFIGGGWVTSD